MKKLLPMLAVTLLPMSAFAEEATQTVVDSKGEIVDQNAAPASGVLPLQEEDYNKKIKEIRSKIKEIRSCNATSLAEYEEDLKFLEKIPENSMNKALAETTHDRLLDNYRRRLRNDIRQYISDNDIPEARKLIEKLSAIPDAANDVKALNKLIAAKEKIKK